jgi:hypothetical protein
MTLRNLQQHVDKAHAAHRAPQPQASTPERALAAEGMTLRPDGVVIPHDGIVNHATPRKPKAEGAR